MQLNWLECKKTHKVWYRWELKEQERAKCTREIIQKDVGNSKNAGAWMSHRSGKGKQSLRETGNQYDGIEMYE